MIGWPRGRLGPVRTVALSMALAIVVAGALPSAVSAGPRSMSVPGTRSAAGSVLESKVSTVAGSAPNRRVGSVAAGDGSASPIRMVPASMSLGNERVGSFVVGQIASLVNETGHPVRLDSIAFSGGDTSDFVVGTDCFPDEQPVTLPPKRACALKVVFTPRARGTRTATLKITFAGLGSPLSFTLTGVGTDGYFLADPGGDVASFGDGMFHGDLQGTRLAAPIVSITPTTTGEGYWLAGQDGGIFSFGDARFFGSTGAMHLNRPVVGMASFRANNGYWLVASDGGIFSFGRARFFGSTGGMHLNRPIVGMAANRAGKGYWLVASDGGIFTFGAAKFFGSTGGRDLGHSIVGMARTPAGNGYWLVSANGAVYAFGDAKVYGSAGGQTSGTFVGIASTPDGRGYWLSNSVGQVFTFGDAQNFGDLVGRGSTHTLAIAATAPTIGPLPKTPRVIDEHNGDALRALLTKITAHRGNRG